MRIHASLDVPAKWAPLKLPAIDCLVAGASARACQLRFQPANCLSWHSPHFALPIIRFGFGCDAAAAPEPLPPADATSDPLPDAVRDPEPVDGAIADPLPLAEPVELWDARRSRTTMVAATPTAMTAPIVTSRLSGLLRRV